jgi:hypothetical protein
VDENSGISEKKIEIDTAAAKITTLDVKTM